MGKKQNFKIAKNMYKLSLTNGLIDEKKVFLILQKLSDEKFPRKVAALKIYKRLLGKKLSWEEIIVEIGTKFATTKDFEKKLLEKTGAAKIRYEIKPEIIFGARLKYGDWVYDETLDAKLSQISTNKLS